MNVCGTCDNPLTPPDNSTARWGCLRCDWSHDADIGSFCRISAGVAIERGVRLASFIELRPQSFIGPRCTIDSYVVTSGDCVLDDDVTLRYGVILARGCRVGAGSYLAPRVMTNNLDHKRKAIGGAKIGKRCFIGTHAVLAAGITICDDVIVGACALVTKDITEPGVYVGVPARKVRDWG